MNKIIVLISSCSLFALSNFAQQNSTNIAGFKGELSPCSPPKRHAIKPPTHVLKANDGDLLWSDDLSGSASWTIGTSGQGTFEIATAGQVMPALMSDWLGTMASTTAANGYAFFNGTQYFSQGGNGPIEAQDTWIMSPTIDFSGVPGIVLSFEQMYRAFNQDETWVEFSADNGNTWVFTEQVNAEMVVNSAVLNNTLLINIPVANATQGRIRFRWKCDYDDDNYGGGYGWCIDDVTITQGYANDLLMYVPYATIGETFLEYTRINSTQATAADNMAFTADVKNKGYQTQNVTLEVTSGAYSGSSPETTIQPYSFGYPEIVAADGMPIPASPGTTTFNFGLSSNNTLSFPEDDDSSLAITITNNIISADDFDGTEASLSGYWLYWGGHTGFTEIGNQFNIFADQNLTAIQTGIYPIDSADQSDYIGKEFYGVLYEYDTDGNPNYIDETEPHSLEATDFGQLITLNFTNPASLISGTKYLVTVHSYQNSEVPVMLSGLTPLGQTRGFDGTNYYYLNGNDAFPNLADAPVVRMDFTNYASVNNLTPIQDVTSFPNPFDQSATLQFELKSDELITIVMTDIAGREVKHFPETLYTSGINTLNLECSVFRSGIYNCTLISASGSRTIRVVKK